MGKCPPFKWGTSLVASIFSASPGSSWRNRLVIRVFIFRLFPTSGKQNVETGVIRAAGKDFAETGLGNSALKPTQPQTSAGMRVVGGKGAAKLPPLLHQTASSFEAPQARDPSENDARGRSLQKLRSPKSKSSPSHPRAEAQKPPPHPPGIRVLSLPPTTAPANRKPGTALPGLRLAGDSSSLGMLGP